MIDLMSFIDLLINESNDKMNEGLQERTFFHKEIDWLTVGYFMSSGNYFIHIDGCFANECICIEFLWGVFPQKR